MPAARTPPDRDDGAPPRVLPGLLLATADQLGDFVANRWLGHPRQHQRLGRDVIVVMEQAQQQMLGTKVVVTEITRGFLRDDDHLLGAIGEALEQLCFHPSFGSSGWGYSSPVNVEWTALRLALRGMTYPCDRQDVVRHAAGQGANDDLLGSLCTLPDSVFADESAIKDALAGDAH